MKILLKLWLFFLIGFGGIGSIDASVFLDFAYGDSPEQVREKASGKCRTLPIETDNRWRWRSQMKCENLVYKKVRTTVYFQFSHQELSRVVVISKNIPNYFLIRNPRNTYLLPRQQSGASDQAETNLQDKLIFRDKVHYQSPDQKLTYFFYKGNWEWELLFEQSGYHKKERQEIRAQLEKESGKGGKGWKVFQFNNSPREIRGKLEGICSKINLDEKRIFQGIKTLKCRGFSFLDQKISVYFKFYEEKLTTINLVLNPSFYKTVLPLIKKKYGTPYVEFKADADYYPYILFPQDSITLHHKVLSDTVDQGVKLILQYVRKGYVDPVVQKQIQEKTRPEKLKKIKTRSEIIMDNL
jgi:hypothetical protein